MATQTITAQEAKAPLFIGVDVGGTSIKVGLVDSIGRTLGFASFPTEDHRGPQDAVNRMSNSIIGLLQSHDLSLEDLAAVGLGTPGTMDIPNGMVLEPPNMPGWRHFPLRNALSEMLGGKPVAFANDAASAAFGEFWVGSGQEHASIVMFTLGTGVGGGIIIGEESLDGQHSHGSECGHVIIDSREDARVCSCGQRGHLEAYASATGVVKRTQESLDQGRPSSINDRLKAGETLSSLMLAQEAEKGDSLSRELVLETADFLSIGVLSLMHIIDPAAIILGGAMDFGGHDTNIGREFLERVRSEVRTKTFPVQAEHIEIDFASLGSDAGYLGAAGLSRVLYNRL